MSTDGPQKEKKYLQKYFHIKITVPKFTKRPTNLFFFRKKYNKHISPPTSELTCDIWSGLSKVWEGPLRPHPLGQGAEGALPGRPDHTEGLQVLQGEEEEHLLASVLLHQPVPGGGRGPAQGGEGGGCYSELLPALQAG